MEDQPLIKLFPRAQVDFESPVSRLVQGQSKFGEIQTYFGSKNYMNPVGIEIEVENVPRAVNAVWDVKKVPPIYWRNDDDGSLRNNGREFISVPLHGRNIDYAITEMERIFELGPKMDFSHRTSIHVHVNVSTYTHKQMTTLVALYALFEGLFFSFVEPIREGNAYCYPITNLSPNAVAIEENMKYCAFNLAPIARQMTVEFRHLEGTRDFRKLRRWVQLCAKLVSFVQAQDPVPMEKQLEDLLSEKAVFPLAKRIFTGSIVFFTEDQIKDSINRGALWALSYLKG